MTAKKIKPDKRERLRAARRVGYSYRELAQWLLDLSQISLDDLSEGDRTNLEWEANVFYPIYASLKRADNPPAKIEKYDPGDLEVNKLPRSVGSSMIDKGFLISFHQMIHNMLEKFTNGIPVVQTFSQSMEIEDGKLVLKNELDDASLYDIHEIIVFNLFSDNRSQFKLCEECETPFMAIKRQKYCSTGCSQAMRTRKFQAKRKKNT